MRSIGYVASSGSRILVPNIVDLSTGAASSALSAVGLVLGSSTGSTSSGATSSNNGYVASQSISAGSYADYGTVVTYTTYAYSPPPPPPTWVDPLIVNSFTAGTPYSDSVSASGATSYSIGQPDGNVYPYWVQGVFLDGSTGAFSGTPSTAGQQYKFFIRASNAGGYVDSQVFEGTVGSPAGSVTSASITFTPAYASSELQGTVQFTNNTGATYSISLSSSAGTISPTSFLVGPYSSPGSPTVVYQPFLVNGLSSSQTVTVYASGGGASASASATTLSSNPSYTYTFDWSYGGSAELSCSGTITSQSSLYSPITGNVTVDAGLCGSQTFYAFTPGNYYWLCCRT